MIPTTALLRLLNNLVGDFVRGDEDLTEGFIGGNLGLYGHRLDLQDKATVYRIASGEAWADTEALLRSIHEIATAAVNEFETEELRLAMIERLCARALGVPRA